MCTVGNFRSINFKQQISLFLFFFRANLLYLRDIENKRNKARTKKNKRARGFVGTRYFSSLHERRRYLSSCVRVFAKTDEISFFWSTQRSKTAFWVIKINIHTMSFAKRTSTTTTTNNDDNNRNDNEDTKASNAVLITKQHEQREHVSSSPTASTRQRPCAFSFHCSATCGHGMLRYKTISSSSSYFIEIRGRRARTIISLTNSFSNATMVITYKYKYKYLYTRRDIETRWKKQNASLRHELDRARKEETKTKRELERTVERRKFEDEERKALKNALKELRREAQKHESMLVELEKKHAEEVRVMEHRRSRLESIANGTIEEIIHRLKSMA
jgi:hypothetical protein